MPFTQLSLGWQVWGDGLLGAIVLMLCLFCGIEWPWLVSLFHVVRAGALRLFTAAGDGESAKPAQSRVVGRGPVRRGHAEVFDIEAERQRLQYLRALGTRRASWTVH